MTVSENSIAVPGGGTRISRRPAWKRLSLALWSVAIGVQLWLLFSDVNILGDRAEPRLSVDGPSRPVVAELARRQHDVRVQNERDVVWQDTQAGQPLLDGQSLMTMERSSAEVIFADGAGLVLGESSLVQIQLRKEGDPGGDVPLMLRLLRGSVRKSPGKKAVRLEVGGTELRASADADVSVSALPDGLGSRRLQVGGGEVEVVTASGSVTARAGESVRIPSAEQSAAPSVEPLPFVLESPAPDAELRPSGDRPAKADFEWRALGALKGKVELSLTADFGGRDGKVEFVGGKSRSFAEDTAGLWYWRVREGDQVSETRRLWVRPVPRAELVFPPEGASIQVEDADAGFSWRIPEGAPEEFRWELLASGAERSVASGKGEGLSFAAGAERALEGLAAGEYRWRVKLGDGPWSAPRRVKLLAEAAAEPAQAAPQAVVEPPPKKPAVKAQRLQAPKLKGKPKFVPRPKRSGAAPLPFPRRAFDRISRLLFAEARAADPVAVPEYEVWLEWQAVEGAKGYVVQVSRTKGFAEPLAEGRSLEARWAWSYRAGQENSKGRVFYRVAALGADGKPGPYSDPEPIAIPEEILAEARAARAPRAPAQPPEPPGRWTLESVAISTSVASFTQTASASDLSSVKTDGLHLDQRISVEASFARGGRAWNFLLEAGLTRFGESPDQDLRQPDLRPLRAALWALRGEESGEGWSLGAYAEWGIRFERVDDLELAAKGG
ncbi:MAG: hypothetical protein IT285_09305, partial [Bdellovibrionales bacterium]|nr:hypothetical protein [Bdellovibrionales bacterium]